MMGLRFGRRLIVAALVTVLVAAQTLAAADQESAAEVRFVVLGHVRGAEEGGLNPKLDELLDEVRAVDPAFVVLTGDNIWGDYNSTPPDPARVTREWDELDAALETLTVPVFRVPGNHDISDAATRNIWNQRYGLPPQAMTIAGVRLLLLSSAWIPERDDEVRGAVGRGVDITEAQLRWLREELSRPSTLPTFVFMHHLLWWEQDTSHWWTTVHPMLVGAGVKAVFSGDYGPLKFSTTERDGLVYYQTSIETPVSLRMLQVNVPSRVLSAQFDNYLEVVVRGSESRVRVHTIGEVSSGEFTPARHNAVVQAPPPPVLERLKDFVGSPRRIAALLLAGGFAFCAGWWVGRRRGRR